MAVTITITDEELQALDDANDGVTAVIRPTIDQGPRASKWVVVVRAPKRTEWKRYVQTREKDLFTAVETIFKTVCVFPERTKLEELLEAPGCAGIPFAALDAITGLLNLAAGDDRVK